MIVSMILAATAVLLVLSGFFNYASYERRAKELDDIIFPPHIQLIVKRIWLVCYLLLGIFLILLAMFIKSVLA
jgi:hypothetical protein